MAYLQTSPKMEALYEDYVVYLQREKHCSPNTLSAYRRDMQKFFDYAEEFGIASFDRVTAADVSSYKQYLLRRGLSASSVSRSLSALRGLYQYLISVGAMDHNPAREIPNDKVAKKGSRRQTISRASAIKRCSSCCMQRGLRSANWYRWMWMTLTCRSPLSSAATAARSASSLSIRWR